MSIAIQPLVPSILPPPVGGVTRQPGIPGQSQIQARPPPADIPTLVSLSARQAPLRLLLSSVIANINESFAPGPAASPPAAAPVAATAQAPSGTSATDNSPAAAADRIVNFVSGLYDSFKTQHPNDTQSATLAQFLTTIRQGIDQGFAEARKILQGLGVLQGDVAAGVDQTYQLVQQKLDAFSASVQGTAAAKNG